MTKIIYCLNRTCNNSDDFDICALSRIFQILTSTKIYLDIRQHLEYPIKSLAMIRSADFHLVTHPSLSCPSLSCDFPWLPSSVSPYIPSPGPLLILPLLYAPSSFHSHILSSSLAEIEPVVPLSRSMSPSLIFPILPSCSKFFALAQSVFVLSVVLSHPYFVDFTAPAPSNQVK